MPGTRLLDMPICNIAIVQNIFDLIDEALTKRNIPWSNVVGFELDTYNMMKGWPNSVLSRLKRSSQLYSINCVCHRTKSMPFCWYQSTTT